MEFNVLEGKVLRAIERDGDQSIRFIISDDETYLMEHWQHCCESVTIEDVAGDLNNLVGHPILLAEEVTQNDDDGRWTFYKVATVLGHVTIRWYGRDNYYSVSVEFEREP